MCVYIYLYLCLYIWIYIVISLYPRVPHSQIWRAKNEAWASIDFGTPALVPHRYKRQPYGAGFLDLGIIDLFIDKSLLLCLPYKIMKELCLNHSTAVYRLCCLCKASLLQWSSLLAAGVFLSVYKYCILHWKQNICSRYVHFNIN